MSHLRNISLKDMEKFVLYMGCKHIRTNGGHAVYSRKDLLRPITLQTHVDPVPEFIVKQTLRHLHVSKEEFFEILLTKP
jgi:predicted RNA binding protein YcfA (HicA-like mRNA interferase family)